MTRGQLVRQMRDALLSNMVRGIEPAACAEQLRLLLSEQRDADLFPIPVRSGTRNEQLSEDEAEMLRAWADAARAEGAA